MRTILMSVGLLGSLSLSSCIIQQTVGMFIRDEYPGERPPMVIEDVNGQPASQNWLKIDPTMLPPSGILRGASARLMMESPTASHPSLATWWFLPIIPIASWITRG